MRTIIFILAMGITSVGYLNCGAMTARQMDSLGSSQPFQEVGFNEAGVRRLSNKEIQNSISDILGGVIVKVTSTLPASGSKDFDNDIKSQVTNAIFIEALENLSSEVAKNFLENTVVRDSVLDCQPSKIDDTNCMTIIAKSLMRSFFRGRSDKDSIVALVELAISAATADSDFYVGVSVLIRYFIQHPAFLLREEAGDLVNGAYQLSSLELASRLSYTIWGSTPDEALLMAAESNELSTKVQIKAQAERMLDSPKAEKQIQRFFALWLSYEVSEETLGFSKEAQDEADTMVAKVFSEDSSTWEELFLLNETKVSAQLAEVYGLNASDQWVSFGAGRKGLLSTAAFLSNGVKSSITSPTRRGIYVREKLLCQSVPPVPANVNIDEPPADVGGSNCKIARLDAHRNKGTGCFNCHQNFDPIGFGLERYDQFGRYREFEYRTDGSVNEECPINTVGELDSLGTFQTTAGLSDLILQSGRLKACLSKQFLHFSYGSEPQESFEAFKDLGTQWEAMSIESLKNLVMATVMSEAFRVRSVKGDN